MPKLEEEVGEAVVTYLSNDPEVAVDVAKLHGVSDTAEALANEIVDADRDPPSILLDAPRYMTVAALERVIKDLLIEDLNKSGWRKDFEDNLYCPECAEIGGSPLTSQPTRAIRQQDMSMLDLEDYQDGLECSVCGEQLGWPRF